MADEAESELIALVAREQQALRRTLLAGFSALFLVVAMSIALGIYYFFIARTLAADSERLEQRAFETRILADDLADRISDQEAAIRRNYEELRTASQEEPVDTSPEAALQVVRDFLERGVHSLAGEKLIARARDAEASPGRASLYQGVSALLEWERGGSVIPRDAEDLPTTLLRARTAFEAAGEDPALRPLSQAGLAWIHFENASSARSNYAPADCEQVFVATEASAPDGRMGPQPRYWRGQCARKQGQVRQALRDYGLALQRIRETSEPETASLVRREARLTLEMNAYHGLGTVLIAAVDAPEDDELAAARQLAREACYPASVAAGSEETQLMHACLQKAMSLRRRLRQTENQVSGTRENLSFVFLRDDDYQGAFQNAMEVEDTGLFAWNELIRAVVAREVGEASAARDARRNVSLFDVNQFNVCELRELLRPDHFEAAYDILAEEHPGLDVTCT